MRWYGSEIFAANSHCGGEPTGASASGKLWKSARRASLTGIVSADERRHFVRSEQVNAVPAVSRRGISRYPSFDLSGRVAA